MRALLYLEYRYLRNSMDAIVRSPRRLAIWLPYVAAIGFLAFSRARHPSGVGAFGIGLDAHQATGVGGMYLALLGVTIALAAGGRVAAFRSSAEAVLFSNAGVAPITIALWLQGRRLAMSSSRYFGSIVYLFLIFSPRHMGLGEAARVALATLLAIAVQLSAELPVFLLARGRLKNPVRLAGIAIAAFGITFAAIGFFGFGYATPILHRIGFDPGRLVLAVIAGNSFALVTLFAILGISALAIRMLGGDAMPELYAVAQTAYAQVGRRRDRPITRFAQTPSRVGVRVPPGALAVVWKDWVGFKRGRGIVWMWLAGCVFWGACGIGVGTLEALYHDTTLLLTLVGMTGIFLVIGAPSSAAIVIAADLGKPLFWLSSAPLRARIAAWTFARTWRGAIAIALGPLAAGLVLGDAGITFLAVPLVFAVFWTLQALGVGLYAVFPNPLDSRGPMVFVRLIATAIFTVPAIAVAALLGIWFGSDVLAVSVAGALFAVQGWIVLELASLHFREHGAALAMLARAT